MLGGGTVIVTDTDALGVGCVPNTVALRATEDCTAVFRAEDVSVVVLCDSEVCLTVSSDDSTAVLLSEGLIGEVWAIASIVDGWDGCIDDVSATVPSEGGTSLLYTHAGGGEGEGVMESEDVGAGVGDDSVLFVIRIKLIPLA